MIIKQLSIYGILLVVLAQASLKTGVVAYYYLNQDYIAQNWCEQRDKPKSCCAGSCQVSKWLKAADNKPQDQNSAVPDWNKFQELQLFIEEWVPVQLHVVQLPAKSEFPLCISAHPIGLDSDIFHPPCLS